MDPQFDGNLLDGEALGTPHWVCIEFAQEVEDSEPPLERRMCRGVHSRTIGACSSRVWRQLAGPDAAPRMTPICSADGGVDTSWVPTCTDMLLACRHAPPEVRRVGTAATSACRSRPW